MNKVFENCLIKTFPDLYKGAYMSPTENLMCFGFECGDGWFSIIAALSVKLVKSGEGIVATQVKEKYGTLRFYILGGTDEVYDLIDAAEEESGKTCERCGAVGSLRERGFWLKTLCDIHNELWQEGAIR